MTSEDSSLLIASRLYRVPARNAVPQATLDVDDDPQGIEWEQWGEEPTIELAECALRFNGEQMSRSCSLLDVQVLLNQQLQGPHVRHYNCETYER